MAVVTTSGSRQQETDGSWVHHGKFSAGRPGQGDAPNQPGDINANRGDGTGVYYFGGLDRVGGGGKYLYWDGARFNLVGGQLYIPAGLAPGTLPLGTVTAQLGVYRAVAAWYVPAINAWYESNAQVSVTTTGGRIRASACGAVIGGQVGTIVYLGLMTDTSVTFDSLTAAQVTVANAPIPFAYTCYSTPSAAAHRFAICIYANGSAGSAGFWGGAFTNLWIHEEKA